MYTLEFPIKQNDIKNKMKELIEARDKANEEFNMLVGIINMIRRTCKHEYDVAKKPCIKCGYQSFDYYDR